MRTMMDVDLGGVCSGVRGGRRGEEGHEGFLCQRRRLDGGGNGCGEAGHFAAQDDAAGCIGDGRHVDVRDAVSDRRRHWYADLGGFLEAVRVDVGSVIGVDGYGACVSASGVTMVVADGIAKDNMP
ncbi:MAG: hypothetical protein F4Y63_07975 [Chloroflexi bacterium]|nr:hypothetical protein [Chloroflexota bacterium]